MTTLNLRRWKKDWRRRISSLEIMSLRVRRRKEEGSHRDSWETTKANT